MPETPVKDQDRIVKQCRAEYEAGLLFRKDREMAWHIIEDQYFNRVKKSLKSRFNVPVPILPGFVETWMANMSTHIDLKFEQSKESEFRAVKKANALLQAQKNHDDYDWDTADTDGKKLAALTGRSIYAYFASSKPSYKATLEPVYHYDFVCDPVGGGDLEKHRFVQRDNIFKNKQELKDGASQGIYDAGQVSKIINATQGDTLIDNDNVYRSKQNAFIALGLDGFTHNYAGQSLYKFIEAGTTWNGERYYCLFNYETGIWVRCQPLKEVFKSELWWFTSWATNRDTFNFWSKGPSDDMVPLSEMIRILINQELDNRNKSNYGMRAFDPDVFPDPAQLEWKPDGLVAVKSGSTKVQQIQNGIYEFSTPQLQGTIDLTSYIDGLLKEKSGVNSENQGQSDTNKVGIAYLNVQQSTERTTLIYESYAKNWQGIGRRFLWGLNEHMRSPQAVKIIGENGFEWDELARNEVNTDWGILIEGGQVDAQKDAIKQKALSDTLAALTPDELAVTNPKWRVKAKLQNAQVDDDEIRLAFDLQGDSDREILSKASELIEACLEGKPYKLYRGATTAIVQKILDFATDNDLEMPEYTKLMDLIQKQMPIVSENMTRKAMLQQTAQGGGMPQVPPKGAPQPPMPGQIAQQVLQGMQNQPGQPQPQQSQPQASPAGLPTAAGTQATSQQASNLAPQPAQLGQ